MKTQVFMGVCLGIVVSVMSEVRSDTFHANLTLSWSEVAAGTVNPVPFPNGIIEPGEGSLLRLSIGFTPIGTPVSYYYPTGRIGAPVAGFRTVAFDIVPTNAIGGGWSLGSTMPGFAGGFGFQFPPEEGLIFCSIYQPSPPTGSFPISENPLLGVWQQVWTPSNYQFRTVSFRLRGVTDGVPEAFVFLGLDPSENPLFGWAHGNGTFGETQVPVAPSPASSAVLVLSCLGVARRRRVVRVRLPAGR